MKILLNLVVVTALLHQMHAVQGRVVQGKSVRRLHITRPVVNKSLNFTFLRSNYSKEETQKGAMPTRNHVAKAQHIIKGTKSLRGQFPWQVGMDIDNDFFCGGSLIALSHILTAAHCAHGSKKFDIVMGAQNRDVFEQGRIATTSMTKVVHPKFNSDSLQNDIAIVTMMKPVVLNNYVKLIRLPLREHLNLPFVDIKSVVSGWGKTEDGDETVSSVMFNVHLTTLTLDQCMQVYGPSSIYRSNICAAGSGDAATCQGDSGGPLVYKETDGEWTQIGVVSYGAATGCEMGYPDVFTRVTSYLGWIQTYVNLPVRPDNKLGKGGGKPGQKPGPGNGPGLGLGGGVPLAGRAPWTKAKRKGKITIKL